jgi:pyruvate/2-oxoglutarate dehydrogenase complex dihydrolipoamide acyltransferase (E2) component
VAILSTDAIRMRPGIISTSAGDMVVPRLLGTIGQSFDHRAFDGAYSAAFLSRLKTVLETRNWEQDFA